MKRSLTPLAVFVASAATLAAAGFRNTMIRDAGGYLYIGQQVLRGVPPYASLFTHKGPLAPLRGALGVALGRLLGLADIIAVRAFFCLIGAATVAALYVLVAHWTGSRRAGMVGALILLGCYPFTFGATAGPEPKLPMLLFVVLSLYLTSRRRWFWAGLCGSLAALTWQPTAIYPAITLFLAALAGRSIAPGGHPNSDGHKGRYYDASIQGAVLHERQSCDDREASGTAAPGGRGLQPAGDAA